MTIDCVALGTGPSLDEYIKNPLKCPHIGCSTIPKKIKCDYYCINDKMHINDIPQDGTIIVAHPRIWTEGFIRWNPNIKYGGTSGGLAIAWAASIYLNIGIVGFDGYDMPCNFSSLLESEVFNYWESRGRTFYSLMKNSIYNKRMCCGQ